MGADVAHFTWETNSRWVVATVPALPVAHPAQPDSPLWLVVCRSQGRSPWYLLTAEAIDTEEQAWSVICKIQPDVVHYQASPRQVHTFRS